METNLLTIYIMVIVQLGSNRGYDGLTKWINQNNPKIDKLILVEPFTIHHKSLEECYKSIENKVIDSSAIGLEKGEFNLYWTELDAPLYEVTSLVKDHVLKHWNGAEVKEMNVHVKTLEDLLDSYSLLNIDWLLIDVEGLDAQIVLGFPWSKFNIKRVDVEHLHLGKDREKVESLFSRLGYEKTESIDLYGYDMAFKKK